MQKLTIRAALEALTYADDEELINELEIRARKKTYKNTYICDVKDEAEVNLYKVVLYAQNRNILIDQIVKNEGLLYHICRWVNTDDEKYAMFIYGWPTSIIDEIKKGNITATKYMYEFVQLMIDVEILVITTIEELYGGPEL